MSRIEPREQIVAMSGYHSPQVDVPVRLNTNESPFAPPAAWVESLAGIAASIDWNRYPDRSATALRAEIASRCDPADIRGYAERLDLELTPMQQADEEAVRHAR